VVNFRGFNESLSIFDVAYCRLAGPKLDKSNSSMKHIFLVLMLIASGVSTSNAQTNFPCTDEELSQNVTWLDYNIVAAGWKETANLTVGLDGTWLYTISDKKDVWPNHYNSIIGASVVSSNVWAVIQHSGKWYAVTWEWLPKGRIEKFRTSFDGGHMKRAPFVSSGQGGPNGWWEPKNGEIYGLMVSDFARFGTQTEATFKERSNVAWLKWGEGEVDVCAAATPEAPIVLAPITDLLLN
jgi:hypothetical protein